MLKWETIQLEPGHGHAYDEVHAVRGRAAVIPPRTPAGRWVVWLPEVGTLRAASLREAKRLVASLLAR